MKEGYSELLKKEMEKRKAWIDEHVGRTPETDDDFKNFKDFNEFKVKYDQNKVWCICVTETLFFLSIFPCSHRKHC